ncbi:MAG: hypothetical protein K9M54_11775, partial [Kiritimatiellales bacterium]|nr:hypothetical protein [Kiritimatiellales bacterium]
AGSGVLQNSIILRNTDNVNFVSLQYNASQPGSEATLRVYVAESGWVTLTNAVLSLPESDLASGVLDTIKIVLDATGFREFANEADVSGFLAYNTPANATALGSIFFVGLHNGSSLWYDNVLVAVPKVNKTHFLAGFDVPDSGGSGTLTNAAQLNAGTQAGSWTVADAQESYLSGTAAGFDQGPYSFTAQMASGAPVADGAVFTVDMRSRRDGSGKYNGIRLKNENGANSVSLRWSGTADGVSGKLDYWTGAWTFITNGIFLPNQAAAFTEGLATDQLVVRMGATGYDVEVNGVVLLTGASYQNVPTTINSVQFFGDGGTNSLAGAWYDTVTVQSALQEGWGPTGFAAWADGWGVNIGAEPADADHDGLSNLYEYGLGGDPTNPADRGLSPEFSLLEVGGSNWLAYIHPQLADPNRGLDYHLELNTNLLLGVWANGGYLVLGTNSPGGAFDYVTNATPTVENHKYIRLIIQSR